VTCQSRGAEVLGTAAAEALAARRARREILEHMVAIEPESRSSLCCCRIEVRVWCKICKSLMHLSARELLALYSRFLHERSLRSPTGEAISAQPSPRIEMRSERSWPCLDATPAVLHDAMMQEHAGWYCSTIATAPQP
jgi:hypothetical protein